MSMVSLAIAGSTTYIGTIANGVYASTDNGNTWSPRITGLKARDMNGFFIDGTTLYGNGNSIFKTTDGGDAWTGVRGNLKDSSAQPTLVYVNGSLLFERDYPAYGLERSTDAGAIWTQAGGGLASYVTLGAIISSGGRLLAADVRIYSSTDNGDTWIQEDAELTGFPSFAGLTKVGSTIYAYDLGVAKSTDEGVTWTKADSGMAAYFGVAGFAVVGSTLFAGGGYPNAVYKSTNDGAIWTTAAPIPSFGGTSQLLALGNDLFACSPNNGIFISKNLGSSWTKISAGLPNTNYYYSLAIQNGWMFAGTSGNSVWKRPLSDVTAVEEVSIIIPGEYALEQNYPNPFNPITVISYSLSVNGIVTLEIGDVLGKHVATIVNEALHPGEYKVTWDASGQASGVYFYRLTVSPSAAQGGSLEFGESYSETKRLIIIK
ncbi:MAG TPA: T9SS type A sorting domain-containing protein [Bacteroidota bacterium]|nr:T9SS type A sorting domain-containing protein [Bacteroidota bacterium]